MPRPYTPEFRQCAVALVRAGKQIEQVACDLGISAGCLHTWVRQDRVDRGEPIGVTSTESAEVRAARNRICELEPELATIRQASKFLAEEKPHPKRVHPVIDRLVAPASRSGSAAGSWAFPAPATTASRTGPSEPPSCGASG